MHVFDRYESHFILRTYLIQKLEAKINMYKYILVTRINEHIVRKLDDY